VWTPADLVSYNFPAPYGKNDRIVATVRAKVKSLRRPASTHNTLVQKLVKQSKDCREYVTRGLLPHGGPGDPAGLEFFAVDTWYDAAGMAKHYRGPGRDERLWRLFATPAGHRHLDPPAGEWVEWVG